MTKMQELKALREWVSIIESGKFPSNTMRPPWLHTDLAWKAYNGSLDAAKALHEAVLPEYAWLVSLNRFAGVEGGVSGPWNGDVDGNPARAWLLAIIRAKISELEAEI